MGASSIGDISFLKMSTPTFIIPSCNSEVFLFKNLDLEVFCFYLSGMPAGEPGDGYSTDGLLRLTMFDQNGQQREDSWAAGEEGFWAQSHVLDHKPGGPFD